MAHLHRAGLIRPIPSIRPDAQERYAAPLTEVSGAASVRCSPEGGTSVAVVLGLYRPATSAPR
jgi:hypothetical protein